MTDFTDCSHGSSFSRQTPPHDKNKHATHSIRSPDKLGQISKPVIWGVSREQISSGKKLQCDFYKHLKDFFLVFNPTVALRYKIMKKHELMKMY